MEILVIADHVYSEHAFRDGKLPQGGSMNLTSGPQPSGLPRN